MSMMFDSQSDVYCTVWNHGLFECLRNILRTPVSSMSAATFYPCSPSFKFNRATGELYTLLPVPND
ncbi:hypothetical protein T265_03498 [Opisthorchis viverrini]|uniref:Uncharacterized protein n=1 Tax=Opisthorchis viverrini TaxID=6198 RepID=A0A075AHK0_OPIVI|nr:hypothetical protein T265_03498 [Opisthorchis viverrini]KER30019.1 hypothetical protein T265_03498 [Opisthorchis viverrini]